MPLPSTFGITSCRRRALAFSIAALGALGASAEPGSAPALKETASAPFNPRLATLEFEAQVRSEASNGVARLALPVIHQRSHATIVQVNAAKGEQALGALSAGFVQRFRPYGGDWVFGFHGFYEARQTPRSFDFQQVAFGLEASRGRHTVRANGWVPVTGGHSSRLGRDRLYTGPTAGFDVEYELALPSPGLQLQPHVAVGYYYLEGTHGVSGKESGVKVRGDVQYRWVTAGVEWREDERAFGGNWLGTFRVTIPFGGSSAPAERAETRLVEPVRRDLWPSTFEQTRQGAPDRKPEERSSPPRQVSTPEAPNDCCAGAPEVIIYD